MKFLIILLLFLMFTPAALAAPITGYSSNYSEKGCLGCSKSLTMANGERLNDNKATVALTPYLVKKYNLMNKYIGIINKKNLKWTIAKVTDTGGFAKYNRIADLTPLVTKALECQNNCFIELVIQEGGDYGISR